MTVKRLVIYVVLLVLAFYCGVTYRPGVIFGNSYVYKNLTLYTGSPLAAAPDQVLARIYDSVSGDNFTDPEQKFEVYLTGGYGEFTFLAPFCGKGYSCLHPATNKVFIASSDVDKNLAYGPGGEGTRLLENVITHELVLAQLRNKFGFLNYTALRPWLKDGYAEHVAKETMDLDPALICGEPDKNPPLAQYLEYRLMLAIAKADAPDMDYPALLADNPNYDNMHKRVLEKYCKK